MTIKSVLLSIAIGSFLIGCADKETDTLCKDHAKAHLLHKNETTQVNVDYSILGEIVAQVKIAQANTEYQVLTNVANVIDVQAEKACLVESSDVTKQGMFYLAKYTVNCGAENKLKKVSVPILDNFKSIDEVEVTINTPSSSKHFVLSRQCDSPIFSIQH